MKWLDLFRSTKTPREPEPPGIFGAADPETCDHEWREREQWHQKFRHEGKTVWVCRRCFTILNTYSWHKPR